MYIREICGMYEPADLDYEKNSDDDLDNLQKQNAGIQPAIDERLVSDAVELVNDIRDLSIDDEDDREEFQEIKNKLLLCTITKDTKFENFLFLSWAWAWAWATNPIEETCVSLEDLQKRVPWTNHLDTLIDCSSSSYQVTIIFATIHQSRIIVAAPDEDTSSSDKQDKGLVIFWTDGSPGVKIYIAPSIS